MIKAIIQRIRVDWAEWWDHLFRMWDMRRDKKRIMRAIASAKLKNSIDGRKYFVIRDVRGFPAAYNRSEILWLKAHDVIPKEAHHVELDKHALAIVTSNKVEMMQYTAVQNKKEKEG